MIPYSSPPPLSFSIHTHTPQQTITLHEEFWHWFRTYTSTEKRVCLQMPIKKSRPSLFLHTALFPNKPPRDTGQNSPRCTHSQKGKGVCTYEWVWREWLINNERTHIPLSPVTSSQNMSQKGICFFSVMWMALEKSAWTKLEPPFQISANSLNFSIVQSLPWAKHGLQRASVKHINEFPWNNDNLTHYQLLT